MGNPQIYTLKPHPNFDVVVDETLGGEKKMVREAYESISDLEEEKERWSLSQLGKTW